jgi:hypothetical protein
MAPDQCMGGVELLVASSVLLVVACCSYVADVYVLEDLG